GWVWGGETVVHVRGDGRGGRNQEVVLGALSAGWSEGLLLCLGTDGIDGKSDAAGALVDAHAAARARRDGLDPAAFLANNDATAFFDAVGTTLRCGPTRTNVADLCLRLASLETGGPSW
ncbi:MAG TPA: MOFRL family protein, partial [Sandaracinaceae bacterium LLY-WYZ-13_1]|nr:MOFRL family protein [Sandaracinaceae bacterium LLY-WYZ-13_1]